MSMLNYYTAMGNLKSILFVFNEHEKFIAENAPT
jgi:hypothetical protein